MTPAHRIAAECDAIKALLLARNAAYGNSALDPVRIFSRADTVEQLRVRIDDKLSRIARGASAGEDVIADLIGYLILLRIATRPQRVVPSCLDCRLPFVADDGSGERCRCGGGDA